MIVTIYKHRSINFEYMNMEKTTFENDSIYSLIDMINSV